MVSVSVSALSAGGGGFLGVIAGIPRPPAKLFDIQAQLLPAAPVWSVTKAARWIAVSPRP